eukprot:TRINITY_DN1504_c0_g1_i1.p1 TRINITY_DN1504_c0_g1~~TRINITY_DN1504_c0_g1_i1.p1  ORF type:complete len:464 (-),score=97.72 TRINITY_DN1504_c0_g1_i1:241-1632(-)
MASSPLSITRPRACLQGLFSNDLPLHSTLPISLRRASTKRFRIIANADREWRHEERCEKGFVVDKMLRLHHSDLVRESPWVEFGESMNSPGRHYAQALAGTAAAAILGSAVLLSAGAQPVQAADVLKTCACLLKECRGELARCLADVNCAANIACLQSCNGRPDEIECQIACGDLFENAVVDAFNTCAVTEKGCVPQKPDEGLYPVPPPTALVADFDVSKFRGEWYISSGLNPSFDLFDCQLHTFSSPGKGQLVGDLTWRINTPDGGFFTRRGIQTFVQDEKLPGALYNHDNEMLHYQDDWYILAARTDGGMGDYVLVYYKGTNDAWDGYGGAVVYTRSQELPAEAEPQLREALKRVNLNFDDFRSTDNSCKPQPPLLARLERKVEEGVKVGANVVVSVGKKELELLEELGRGLEELGKDEVQFLRGLGEEEQRLMGQFQEIDIDPADLEDLFSSPVPLRRRR